LKLRGLAGALLCLLSALAFAIEPFEVKDIRIEGIQRVEAGTVFSYLPIKVGDQVDDDKAAAALRSLYATGFFSDVRLEQDGDVLVVVVQERPAVGQIDITGAKEFKEDQLKESLKQIGLAEGRIYDKSVLDRAEKELKRQYLTRGRYAAEVTTSATPLERNRVVIAINVIEGDVAKIRAINIIGNKVFREKELLGLFQLTTPGYLTWFTKNDQYSRQKLSGDLEALRSYYLDRGYLEFNIDSTQVQISPDKQDIYLTVNITEGPKYKVSDVKYGANAVISEAQVKSLVTVKPGDDFSRNEVTESTKRIGDRLANEGYSFASVNATPEVNKEKQTVAFAFNIDPGRRVYVRRVNVIGNVKTRDEVIRREMRQMEGGWYSAEKISRSRERLDRLGFFSEVNIETPPVAGVPDQVDVNVSVIERSTGNIQVGAGYSNSDKVVIGGSITQSNVFGTGNQLSAQINTGKINRTISVSYTNPYYTADGVSRGFDIYQRNVDADEIGTVSPYRTKTLGGGVRFGIPVTETDSVTLGVAYERTKVTVFENSRQQFKDFVQEFGETSSTIRGDVGWARDSRDSIFYPTKGRYQRVYGELGLPGGDLTYYKLNYQHQWLYPLTRAITVSLNGELGYGDGFRGKDLPFFKNFYAGGVSSVRGYKTSGLGPKDEREDALGGTRRVLGNFEVLFPLPGTKNDKSFRLSLFADAGQVYGKDEKIDLGQLRYSSGVAVSWFSPIGPLKLSFGVPLNKKEGDKVERFQFLLGTVF
jgi:outer membrane protein insertion porin family